MNDINSLMAISACAEPPLSCFAPSPTVSAVPASIDYRGRLAETEGALFALAACVCDAAAELERLGMPGYAQAIRHQAERARAVAGGPQ